MKVGVQFLDLAPWTTFLPKTQILQLVSVYLVLD